MAAAPSPLDPEESRRVAQVVGLLSREGGPNGFVPFDRFMEIALYAEGVGYYAREETPFGRSGDYYTAAHVHPLFGQALAERVRVVRKALGEDRPFQVVEVGPGDGSLAVTMLEALGRRSETRSGMEYLLIERSTPLREHALQRIEAVGREAGIPVRLATAVGSDGPFEGVIVANEILDAQPARRLRWTGQAWSEMGIRVVEGRLVAAEAPLTGPVPLPELPTPSDPDRVLEVSPVAEAWVRSLADYLVRGVALLIDYGLEQSELLAAHPRGTLASVRRHRALDDPLDNPGASDLSVFVNFTRMRDAALRAGFEEVAYCSQAEALGVWGFPALLDAAIRAAGSAEAEVRVRLAAKNLLFGFERFRVLELSPPASAAAVRAAT